MLRIDRVVLVLRHARKQGWETLFVIDIRLRYSLLFVHRMRWSFYFLNVSIEYVLVFTFSRGSSIFYIRFFLSWFFYLNLANNNRRYVTKRKIFNSKVASHILCPSFVCKLPHECEDITSNAWRTPLNAQCNIEYRLQYSLFFFLNYHRNRLFLYFLVNYRIWIISLLL